MAAVDTLKHHAVGATAPVRHLIVITPSDYNDLAHVTRGIYVGTGGDLAVLAADDDVAVTLTAVAPGWQPIQARRVLATGTTALGLVGGY